MISRTTPSMELELIPALPEQQPILANMLELYAYDFSEFVDLQLGSDGRFGYKHLSLYWTESNRYPFIIRANGNLAGLVLVRRGSEISHHADTWDMAEFFILRSFRRLGLGTRAAQEIWKKFPGKWEVRVIDRNQSAVRFWNRAIEEFIGTATTPSPFEKNGVGWQLFSFECQDS